MSVAKVHEGVELVMACSVFLYPGGIGLKCAPVISLYQVVFLPGQGVELPCRQLHVVNIIILFIKIGRDVACSLGGSQVSPGKLKSINGLRSHLFRKGMVILSKDLCPHGKDRRKLACRGGYTLRAVLEPGQSLWLACNKIDRPVWSETVFNLVKVR